MLGSYRKRLSRSQARQLVLACAYFDDHGRIMVSSEGSLPCVKITDHYVEKTFGEDELNRTHPSFVWVFKASRNWVALKDLIPSMKENLESDPKSRKYYPGRTLPSDTASISSNEDFSGMFKKLFCVAALSLANSLHEPLETLGLLFEEPLETGTLNEKSSFSHLNPVRRLSRAKQPDVETTSIMPVLMGRGQYLFLDRRLDKSEVVKYGARGYRFATPKQISESLASSMQIPQDLMLNRLERMRMFSSKENLLPAGMHLACFFARPSVQRSFDVLVPTKTQGLLPHISFSFTQSTLQDMDTLQNFNEWTVGEILKELIHQSVASHSNQSFRCGLYQAFSQLVELIGDPAIMMEARFSSKQISAPCRQPNDGSATSTCIIYSVRAMATVEARSPRPELTYVPLSFFSAQQQLEASPWSHDIFAKQAHLEFAYLGRSKSLIASKDDSRKQSAGEITLPSTPTSFLGHSFGRHRGVSRKSDDSLEIQTDVPSEKSNDEDMELTSRVHAHLSLGSLRDAGIEDSGTFVTPLFALFKL
jgi:hypothetical protein